MVDNTTAQPGRTKEIRITGAMVASLVGIVPQVSRLEDKMINMSMSAAPAMRARVNNLTDRFQRAVRAFEDELKSLSKDAEVDGRRKDSQRPNQQKQSGQRNDSAQQAQQKAQPKAQPKAGDNSQAKGQSPKAEQGKQNEQGKPAQGKGTQQGSQAAPVAKAPAQAPKKADSGKPQKKEAATKPAASEVQKPQVEVAETTTVQPITAIETPTQPEVVKQEASNTSAKPAAAVPQL